MQFHFHLLNTGIVGMSALKFFNFGFTMNSLFKRDISISDESSIYTEEVKLPCLFILSPFIYIFIVDRMILKFTMGGGRSFAMRSAADGHM